MTIKKKAWAVIIKELAIVSRDNEDIFSWKDMSLAIFESKVGANKFARQLQPDFRKKIKVIPILLTYSLPKKGKKKR